MNGVIIIYKEKDFTSHDVVAKMRGILKTRQIGHTGTLDPQAEGVLPVCIGNATKLCDLLTDKEKTYETVLQLGVITDTLDMTGTIKETREVAVTECQIREVIETFKGEQEQIPPMYSALKVNGKKLYEYARAGIEIERQPRKIVISKLEILSIDIPYVTFRVTCSKGTYIRSLCDDIGSALGCGGAMKELTRTKVSSFSIEQAIRLCELEQIVKNEATDSIIIPTDKIFTNVNRVIVPLSQERFLFNGNTLPLETEWICMDNVSLDQKKWYLVYDSEGRFQAIYQFDQEKQHYKPYKMFLNR